MEREKTDERFYLTADQAIELIMKAPKRADFAVIIRLDMIAVDESGKPEQDIRSCDAFGGYVDVTRVEMVRILIGGRQTYLEEKGKRLTIWVTYGVEINPGVPTYWLSQGR